MNKVIVIRWKTTGNIVKGLEDQNKEFSLFRRMRIFNPFSTPTKLERCDTFPFLSAHGTVCESPLGCNEGERGNASDLLLSFHYFHVITIVAVDYGSNGFYGVRERVRPYGIKR